MSGLPNFSTLVEPTNHPRIDPTEPSEIYELDYVYGYRNYDCRQNVFFVAPNKIVFHASAVGIVMDIQANTQKFFGAGIISRSSHVNIDEHDKDIVCLSISPDRKSVATGQLGPDASFFVWDVEKRKLKASKSKYRIPSKDVSGIGCCAWSADGKNVAFVDKHIDHNVYVLQVEKGTVLKQKSGPDEVLDIGWNMAKHSNTFATCGIRHIRFWELSVGAPVLHHEIETQTLTSITFNDKNTCFAGGIDGKIYVFLDGALSKDIQAHTGPIHTLNWVEESLLSGGQDKKINKFDKDLTKLLTVDVPSIPRALDMLNGKILVGMRNGSIICISGSETAIEIMTSHDEGEVWGLEVLEDGKILTTGDDNKLMLWNSKERKNMGVYPINDQEIAALPANPNSLTLLPNQKCSRAICYNEQLNDVAVALNSGDIQIRDLKDLKGVKKLLHCDEKWIECICYSPDGEYLAAGSHSNNIVVFSTDTYTIKGTLKGHKDAVLAFDWSKDSKYIRSVCDNNELMFFSIATMERDAKGASNLKGIEWNSQTTKIGWSLTGIFPKGVDASHVNGVAISSNEKLIATGDDYGNLNIFRNPCREGHQCKAFR